MDRRGDTAYMLGRAVDIVFAFLIILVLFFVISAIWNALHAEQKRVENTYDLLGDLVQGMIDAPDGPQVREFAFNFEEHDEFAGTIFARSSDGRWSSPFPSADLWSISETPIAVGTDIDAIVAAAPSTLSSKAKRACFTAGNAGKAAPRACLCYSNVKVEKKEDLGTALGHIQKCRSFTLPEGKHHLELSFGGFSPSPGGGVEVEEHRFPTVNLYRFAPEQCTAARFTPVAGVLPPTEKNSICIAGKGNS